MIDSFFSTRTKLVFKCFTTVRLTCTINSLREHDLKISVLLKTLIICNWTHEKLLLKLKGWRESHLIKVISLNCTPLLICHVMWDLKKLHYIICESPYVMIFAVQWKWHFRDYESVIILNCFACFEDFDWPKKTVIICIYHILKYSWLKVTHMWPVTGFLQICLDVTSIKGR